jgi:hypothetical protein
MHVPLLHSQGLHVTLHVHQPCAHLWRLVRWIPRLPPGTVELVARGAVLLHLPPVVKPADAFRGIHAVFGYWR